MAGRFAKIVAGRVSLDLPDIEYISPFSLSPISSLSPVSKIAWKILLPVIIIIRGTNLVAVKRKKKEKKRKSNLELNALDQTRTLGSEIGRDFEK